MRVILPICRWLLFHKHPHRYSDSPPPWALSRSGITPLALAGLMATTALSPMDVKATGKGNQTNSTTATSLVTLTTMVSQINLGKGAQNHTSQTTPITRQPVRHRHTKHPAPFSLTHTQPRRFARSGPRPTSVAPLLSKVKSRGQPSRSTTGRSKGSYPARDVKIHDTVSPSIVAYTTDKTTARYRAGKRKKRYPRNGRWSERTSHYLSSYHREEDLERSSECISQTEEPPVLTTPPAVEPTPTAFVESKPTVPSSFEPTPSFLPEPTLSSSSAPTPSLLESTSTRGPEPSKPRPKPTCPPWAERPTLKFIQGDNQGNIEIELKNSPEFIEMCQPLAYRIRSISSNDSEYQLIAANLTANNTRFWTSTERSSDHSQGELSRDDRQLSHDTGDQQGHSRNTRNGTVFNIYFNATAVCGNNPSLNRRTGWLITQSYDSKVNQSLLVAEEIEQTSWSTSSANFEHWYEDNGGYQNKNCTDKYDKMQLELAGLCPVTVAVADSTDTFVYVRIFTSFDHPSDCFSSSVRDSLLLNGYYVHRRVRFSGIFRGFIKFDLNCKNLQHYAIWEHGSLNFTLSRNTTRPGGKPDQADILIPIQKLPYVTGVELDRDNRRLTIQFQAEPSSCLAVVVTTAPFPAFEQGVNGSPKSTEDRNQPLTANNTEPSSTDWGQVFLCRNPDRVLSVPLGHSGPEQSDVVLISLIPEWDIKADFSPENPRDRDLVQGAEHLVAYPGAHPPWDKDNPGKDDLEPDAPFTIKPCTGRCQTHLSAMLANISNVTSGPCPWVPPLVTTGPTRPADPTPPNDRSENRAWLLAFSGAAVLAPCATSLCVGMGVGGYMMCKARQKTRPASDPPTHVESKEPPKQEKSSL